MKFLTFSPADDPSGPLEGEVGGRPSDRPDVLIFRSRNKNFVGLDTEGVSRTCGTSLLDHGPRVERGGWTGVEETHSP